MPVARALAIAGERIAGGVGTHEVALPTPDVVDLRGRCVLPGFTDSHVHFPTWSLAQRDVRLEGVSALAEALERVRRHPRHGGWIRGIGWRSAEWETQPTKEALDEVTGDTPAMLFAKDYHSLWLNSAALARAGGDLEVEGGVVERDEDGAPTGVLREESAWQFRARFAKVPEDEWIEATRAGLPVAAARGVVAVHDKDGWLGAPGIFQRVAALDGLTLRVWQSVPVRAAARARSPRRPRADRRRLPPDRLPEGVHGRDARLPDRVDARRLRRRHHEPGGARGDRSRRRGGRLARRRPRDRRRGEPRGVGCIRGDARPMGAARAAPESRARAVSCPGGRRSLCGARRRVLGAVQPCPIGSRPRGEVLAGSPSTARTHSGRSGTRAPSSPTAPMLRSKSSTRLPAFAPVSCARSTIDPRGVRSRP